MCFKIVPGGKELQKVNLVVEILKLLSERGEKFISTTEIFNELRRRGVLEGAPQRERAERKRLQRALSDLLEGGYVERRFYRTKGKRPDEWRINLKAFPYFVSYSEEELISLFTLISFVPKKYRELEVLKPAMGAIERLGKGIDSEKKEIARESFDYLPVPVERFAFISNGTLKLIFEAIVEKKGLIVNYAGHQKEIFPVKLFTYNGVFYLSSVDLKTKEHRSLLVQKMRALSLIDVELPDYFRQKFKDVFFLFDREPFILKVRLPADYYRDVRPEHGILLYPTQFNYKLLGDEVEVLLVGYPSYRFASWIVLDELIAISPPSEEDVEVAREKGVKRDYPDLSYSLKVNRERFNRFARELKRFFEKRSSLLKNLRL